MNTDRVSSAFSHHEKAALYLSGGKDSLACLYLLRDYWPRLTVVWCEGGDAPRETYEMMERVRDMVPNFLQVRSSAAAVHAMHGFPTDIIPVDSTPHGEYIVTEAPRMQSRYDCCRRVIWEPMHAAIKEHGFTLLIRGQKDSDSIRPRYRDGYVEDGMEVLNPIEHWTDTDVYAYLAEVDAPMPNYYRYSDSNPDCIRCTAYLSEKRGAYLRDHEPEAFEEYRARLSSMATAIGPAVTAFGEELARVFA